MRALPLLFIIPLLFTPLIHADERPPGEPGKLYNRNATIDQFMAARSRGELEAPSLPAPRSRDWQPGWLTYGGFPVGGTRNAGSTHTSDGWWASRSGGAASWLPSVAPLGLDTRTRWPLGLQPFDRRTQRSLEKVIASLD